MAGGQPLQQHAMQTLQAQQQAISKQNAELDSLEAGVATVKEVATLLHSEADSQNRLLDELDREMEKARVGTREACARTTAVIREGDTYTLKTFCMLLWPLVLLLVLVFEAIVHFLF